MNPLMQVMAGGPLKNISSIMGQIGQIKQAVNGDPNAALQMLSRQNPQFAQFLRDNQGKSPEQIAQDYGIDWSMIQNLL